MVEALRVIRNQLEETHSTLNRPALGGREAMMRYPLRLTALFAAALALFSAGFAAGQHQAPSGDERVEQTLLASIDLAKTLGTPGDRELRLSHVTVAGRPYRPAQPHRRPDRRLPGQRRARKSSR
jgi:hypothetical protein